MTEEQLPVAHRVWTEIGDQPPSRNRSVRRNKAKGKPRKSRLPNELLVFDTETTTDKCQSLTFGCYRIYRIDADQLRCIEEGLLYADDLPDTDPAGYRVLCRYVKKHQATTDRPRPLRLLSRSEFVDRVFMRSAYKNRSRVVGFNLPFDLSRLAIDAKEGRKKNFGGISLVLSGPKNSTSHFENRHKPRVAILHRDSKGSFISFTKPMEPDEVDLIPEDSPDGEPEPGYVWPGRFPDLRTLAYALTSKPYTLDRACSDFGVEGKANSGGHGVITPKYISYCRKDVAATAGLYQALIEEFNRHPIDIEPEQAYSPASLSKAYLAAMGITPLLERHPDFPPEVLGYAMAAFFGGRAECRIRRHPVPVVLVDYTSMYPTVDALLDLHRLQLARSIRTPDRTEQVVELLERATLEDCFAPAFWPQLVGFALVQPEDDILPVRAAYTGKTWGIGVNPVTSTEPLWYSLADCVASKLLTGNAPKVLRAIRLEPVGRNARLRPVKLRGTLTIDPLLKDPMAMMIEERQRVRDDTTLANLDRDRLSAVLKMVANAGAYGIYSEINPRARRKGETTPVLVHGRKEAFRDRVTAPEDPGRYCFPPFASCITGAARLMLALLERCVTDLGGTWAFCDTDSMAIVATETGGLVPCPGGPLRTPEAADAVQALSNDQVEAIRRRFVSLNPYDPVAVPQILKRETSNPVTCLAISAKRYALYDLDAREEPVFVDDHPPSEHGLGHFLNPTDPASEDHNWIAALWWIIVLRIHGQDPELPAWSGRPTMVRTTVTSPPVLRAFRHLNEGRPYVDQVKPFNFVLTAAGAKSPASVPMGEPFRLVAPYETDPRRWSSLGWVDVHHPEAGRYPITTRDGRPGMARVDTFADVLAKYETHPESKSLGPDGRPCGRGTVGLLRRRPVTVGTITLIGKESNRLEERSRGELAVDDLDERITTYDDHDEWYRVVLPRLRGLGVRRVASAVGMSERRVRDVLVGRALPHQGHQQRFRHLNQD